MKLPELFSVLQIKKHSLMSAFFECEKYFSAELLRPRDAASTQSCRVY